MKKHIVIHFGIHRTGTTHLQRLLKRNQKNLLQQGVLYPHLGGDTDNHSHIAWGLISGKMDVHELLKRLRNEVDDSIHTIILSHEDFSLIQDSMWLRELREHYDVRVIIYLRRQDLWLESWYNQHIKWPWNKKFSSSRPAFFLKHYKDFYWIDYSKLLRNIADALGRESLYVNTIEVSSVTDSTEDFMRQTGICCETPEEWKDTNASISTAKLDILRRIDLITLRKTPLAKTRILRKLQAMEVAGDDGSKIVFNDDQVKFILNVFAESNNNVAQQYFGRERLFEDPVQLNRKPCFVSDRDAYRIYIPQLLKEIAKG